MTNWVGPCKIIFLGDTTLKFAHTGRPDDAGELIKKVDISWPESWRNLFQSGAAVAISIDASRVLIEPYDPLKHGAQIEIEIDYDPDRNAARWLDDLLDEWAESRGLSRDNP